MPDLLLEDLLLEIGTEELPAGFIEPALDFLKDALPKTLAELRLDHGEVRAEGTPRRLVVIAKDVSTQQPDKEEEVTGPKVEIAWAKDGALSKAGAGFLRGRGLDESAAYKKQTKKGEVIAALVKEAGQPARDVLPTALADLIGRIPFKKKMRWSDEKTTFGRPPRWLCCLLGANTVDLRWGGLTADNKTYAHRFHAPEPQVVSSVASYEAALETGQVTLPASKRRAQILEKAQALAKDAGGHLVEDEPLLHEVGNLVERPWPLLGTFDPKFLAMPRDILLSEMREHQKYFAVEDGQGNLLPVFVVVAGSEPVSEADVAGGHARVLRSRFEDGAFYYRQDLKVSLDDHRSKLANVLFQRDLGTVADKAARVSRLVVWLAEAVAASDEDKASAVRASELAKADLVTGVVGEFPDLQGTMGRYYALASGEPAAVAAAIEDHYAPRGAQDALPTSLPGALVAVADRLDTLVGILGVAKAPKGSADPFALRRASIAILNIMVARGWRCSLQELVAYAVDGVADSLAKKKDKNKKDKRSTTDVGEQVLDFLASRLRGVLSDRLAQEGLGQAQDIVDAAKGAGFDDLADLDARTRALTGMRTEDSAGFLSLAATFKRVGNILAKARADGHLTEREGEWPAVLIMPAEKALLEAVNPAREQATAALHGDADYPALLKVISGLKPQVDTFFDDVMVMADEPELRQARLNLLASVESMLLGVADFRRIQVD